ncbi:MAG: divalent-cation tolerance protein CutA [Xanthomonadales bacterium]|nr:divalent-cation tolerance protein CutA [Xanthomonadales bacterium]
MNEGNAVLVVLCSCPDIGSAEMLAAGLVEHRLAACVSILPSVRSVYRWQGKTIADSETLMLVKTARAALAGLESWLVEHHPYDLPEIIALPVQAGLPEYLDWVVNETGHTEHEQ